MGKSSINYLKKVARNEHDNTPAGKLEKELRRLYQVFNTSKLRTLTKEQDEDVQAMRKDAEQQIMTRNEKFSNELKAIKKTWDDKRQEAEEAIDKLGFSLLEREVKYLQAVEAGLPVDSFRFKLTRIPKIIKNLLDK